MDENQAKIHSHKLVSQQNIFSARLFPIKENMYLAWLKFENPFYALKNKENDAWKTEKPT